MATAGDLELESVEGTIAAMRKESSVQQFITIREMDRRQSQAHEEKKARIIESKKKAAAAKVNLAAAVESADLMADIAMIEKEKVYYHKATRAICKTRPHATRRRWRGDFLVLRTPRAQNESYHAKVHQFYMPKTPESMRWLDSGPEIWAPTYPSHTHTRSCP